MTTTPKREQAGPRSGPASMRVTGVVWVFGIFYSPMETAFGLGTPDHHNRGVGPYRFDYAARDAALRRRRCGAGAAVVARACVGGVGRARGGWGKRAGAGAGASRSVSRSGAARGRAGAGEPSRAEP
jgi:hypothetical protein